MATSIAPQKLAGIRADLNLQVLDQSEAIDLCLTAVVMNDHVALVGPQGEGKTFLAERLAHYIPGDLFYHLLSRFSAPDEVLGHHSLAKLQQDIYERRTVGRAPEAELVVLDEVFKANSPMLNSLLGMMNERVVDGIPCKLRTLVGLSNEWPRSIDSLDRSGDDESLLPLWDRFVLRLEIQQPQADSTFKAIIRNSLPGPSAPVLSAADLTELEDKCVKLHENISDGIINALLDIRSRLVINGVHVSSRRWYKASKALAGYAVVCGDDAIKFAHLKVLRHVLWGTPEQREAVADAVMQSGAPETAVALNIEAEIEDTLATFSNLPRSSADRPNVMHDLIKTVNANIKELERLDRDPKTVDHDEVRRVIARLKEVRAEMMAEMHAALSL